MQVSLPALAQRVTVLGSTRNITATSPGVNRSGSWVVIVFSWTREGLFSWTPAVIRDPVSSCGSPPEGRGTQARDAHEKAHTPQCRHGRTRPDAAPPRRRHRH